MVHVGLGTITITSRDDESVSRMSLPLSSKQDTTVLRWGCSINSAGGTKSLSSVSLIASTSPKAERSSIESGQRTKNSRIRGVDPADETRGPNLELDTPRQSINAALISEN